MSAGGALSSHVRPSLPLQPSARRASLTSPARVWPRAARAAIAASTAAIAPRRTSARAPPTTAAMTVGSVRCAGAAAIVERRRAHVSSCLPPCAAICFKRASTTEIFHLDTVDKAKVEAFEEDPCFTSVRGRMLCSAHTRTRTQFVAPRVFHPRAHTRTLSLSLSLTLIHASCIAAGNGAHPRGAQVPRQLHGAGHVRVPVHREGGAVVGPAGWVAAAGLHLRHGQLRERV